MNTTTKILSGFLAGAAIGTITGILIAPDKGKNTLRKIKDESKHLSDEIGQSLTQSIHSLTHASREMDKGTKGDKEFENGKLETSKLRS
jgi:gas vesicle protein